jgi:hypothetical protein
VCILLVHRLHEPLGPCSVLYERVTSTQGGSNAAPAGVLLFGEEAAAFLHILKTAFASPPAYLRRAMRRSEDWWHKRAELAMSTGPSLPQLLRSVEVSLKGGDFGVQHHVVSSGDPGEVHFRPAKMECASLPA